MLVYCGQTVKWIKMKLGVEVGLGAVHIVLDGDSASSPPKGHMSVNCGQTPGFSKTPLGREVGLAQGEIVLDGDLSSSPKRGTAP